jgi:hypothetical protein
MAAFDITTQPRSLTLKPGSTGSIMVVISNRLGRPVMSVVEGTLTPASASRWLVSPPELQRRYEADPAATANYEFKVNVPKDAPGQPVQFKASVRDVMSPDDTCVEGQTVGINVTADAVAVMKRSGVPWWVWAAAAVVVLAVGLGIYFVVRPKGVPSVVGMTAAEASETLTEVGFAPVTITDTVDTTEEDTNTVVRQKPEAKTRLPSGSMKGKTPASIVVNRVGPITPTLPTVAVAQGNDMQPGEVLRPDTPISSANGRYRFVYQSDGNLVLYRGGTPLWASNTYGSAVGTCIMQGDGNLVIYLPNQKPIWSSDTWHDPGSRLVVQDDGNVVIYRPDNTPLWATNTWQAGP